MRTLLFTLFVALTFAEGFIRFPYPGLPSTDLDGKNEHLIFRKKQQAYLLINMLRVNPQAFVEKFIKPITADDSWKIMFKTESIRLKKFPDYYPLYQDALLEQTARHARLGESFANVRARLNKKLPARLDGFVPGYKPLKLLAQTLMWRTRSRNDFFVYLCHGTHKDLHQCGRQDLVLGGCKPDFINRKTPRGRVRFLLRPTGAVGCNNVDTMVKDDNLFACDVTYPDFAPKMRVKSPMVAGNWFYTGIGNSRVYAVVIHVPQHERVNKVELIIDGKIMELPLTYQNGVTKVYSIAYTPLQHIPSLMKGYFFHAEINGKNFFYPAQYYYDWDDRLKLDTRQRYDGFCKVPFPDRTCDICDDGYRNENGTCRKCLFENCNECTANVCTKCAKGYLLSHGECLSKCIDNCDECTYASTCDKCKPTYYAAMNGTCLPCSEKFQDCATCNQDKCLTYLCQKPNDTCPFERKQGYYFSEVTEKCEKCTEGCKRCEYDHVRGSRCNMCQDGLFLTEEGECIPCNFVDGCEAGQCDGFKCMSCRRGYHLSGSGCVKCDEACAACDINGKCAECVEGYVLDEEYGKCIENYVAENCEVRDERGHCKKCQRGYGFDKYHKCMKCNSGCKECSLIHQCSVCEEGFFLENGMCVPCKRRGCDLCDAKECFSCQPNSYLHNGVCVRGPSGCSLCHNKAPVCKICDKGMKMQDGQCVPDCDIKNCAICNGDETCKYCKSVLNPFAGYEPAPNASDPCPFVCDPAELNCVVTSKMKAGVTDVCYSLGCKICPPHSFRKDHKCVSCGNGCDKCLNEKQCIKCKPGFSYYMGKCYECNKNGTCGDGEYMEGCTCKNCNKKFEHCAACDKDQCIVCADGFHLSENKTVCVPCTKKTCPPPKPKCRGPRCGVIDECDEKEKCPPPEDEPVVPQPEEKKCKAPKHFTKVGDEYVFNPYCAVVNNETCYCDKCECQYVLNDKHICVFQPITCPGDKVIDYDMCTCREKECKCGRNETTGQCIENGPAPHQHMEMLDNCTYVCTSEYTWNGTECIRCNPDCLNCIKDGNGTTCIECKEGYIWNETLKECVTCDTPSTCGCKQGEYLNGTKCESCPCKECVFEYDKVYCTLCEDDTVPIDGECPKSISKMSSGSSRVSVMVAVLAIVFALMF